MASNAPVPAQSNWFTEWSARTPIVTRWTILLTLPISIIALFVPVVQSAMVLTPAAVFWGQVWRFVTTLFIQSGLSILFVLLFLVLSGPAMELRQGSLGHLSQILLHGFLISLTWVAIISMFIIVWPAGVMYFGGPVSSG
jgi:hypothetical protein